MRRLLCLILCIVIAASVTACSSDMGAAVKTPVYPDSISFDNFNSRMAVREKNKLDEVYKNALSSFTYNSASKILRGQTKNVNYSPMSLYMALSLAGTGASSKTQEEILSALSLSGKSTNYLSQQNGNLFRLLYSDNEIGKLKIANSLWLQKDVSFKNTFIDNAVQNFYASLYSVDFANNNTDQLMSKWITENTKGVLSPSMNVDKEQIMSIINTIYFKDEWIDRFNENATKLDNFYLSDGGKVKCDFLNMDYSTHGFVKGDGFTASSLSLKNSGSMMFILPDKGVSVDNLLSTPEKTALLFNEKDITHGKVIFKIPKFSFGSSLDLNDVLKAMGIKSAFEQNADFSGITDHKAFISSIRQQSHIAIDEKGVEAAAFTEMLYAGAAPPKDKIAEMILDRPFIFAIKPDNNRIIFMGVVNNPLEK